jgi:hypothetical protein
MKIGNIVAKAYSKYDKIVNPEVPSLPFNELRQTAKDGWVAAITYVINTVNTREKEVMVEPDFSVKNTLENWSSVYNFINSFDGDMVSYAKALDGTLILNTRKSRLTVNVGDYICMTKGGTIC